MLYTLKMYCKDISERDVAILSVICELVQRHFGDSILVVDNP